MQAITQGHVQGNTDPVTLRVHNSHVEGTNGKRRLLCLHVAWLNSTGEVTGSFEFTFGVKQSFAIGLLIAKALLKRVFAFWR